MSVRREHAGASDPYKLVRDWWQEPVSVDLIDRVRRAPVSHVRQFWEFAYWAPFAGRLDEAKLGELRPLVLQSWIYDQPDHSAPYDLAARRRYFRAVLSLSLYAHGVLMEDPLTSSAGNLMQDRENLANTLEQLLAIHPLVEAGIISFLSMKVPATHPSTTFRHFVDADWSSDYGRNAAAVLSRVAQRQGADTFQKELFHYRSIVGAQMNVLRAWPGSGQLLARSAIEDALQNVAVGEGSRAIKDSRGLNLRKLAAMSVPDISSSTKGLIELRNSAAEFADWRTTLAAALTAIQEIPTYDENWEQEARALVASELAPIRERLETATGRSPAITAMKKGIKDLTLSGLGATAGAVAGGRLGPALAGAVSGKVAEVFVEYVKAVRERRRSKAILDIALRFDTVDFGKPSPATLDPG